jgi:sphingolipid 4-desaturase/C4-monooxygenase
VGMDFPRSQEREPHAARTRDMLVEHPELKALYGRVPATSLIVFTLVAAQLGLAALLRDAHWGVVLGVAWCVGAFIDHALWVLIHESSHNLIFEKTRSNIGLSLVANLPILFPSAVSFRKYHLLHHRYQGDPSYDADLPTPLEARLVRNIWWRKALWFAFFFLVQGTRVPHLKRVPFWDAWYVVNLVAQVLLVGAVYWGLGGMALFFLFASSAFAIGLHPLGARWIQEHYLTTDDGQETYSYYGPLNRLALNVGYHNEHHDLIRVPWTRLPQIRALAPRYYDSLTSHTSWTRLWLRFIFDPKLGLYSRMLRSTEAASQHPSRAVIMRTARGETSETAEASEAESVQEAPVARSA